MKKEYTKPSVDIYEIGPTSMICDSLTEKSDNTDEEETDELPINGNNKLNPWDSL